LDFFMLVTLVNPPGLKTFAGLQMQTPNPNLGLAYISAAAKEAGYECVCVDGLGEALDKVRPYEDDEAIMVQGLDLNEIVARIPAEADVIGLSCMFSNLWPLTHRLAQTIRERFPDAVMVLGGEHGTAVPEYTLRVSPFDVIVLGEGEETFINLLGALDAKSSLADVAGIAFKAPDGSIGNTGLSARTRDIDALPVPDWSAWPIERYIERGQINGVYLGRSIPILATRGCPYKCSFCSNPQMWTRRWIPRDPKLLVDEMQHYIETYGVTNFDFQDLTFVVNRKWTLEFCGEIIDRGLKITWQMPSGTRAEAFDAEVIDALYRAGCRVIAFAPESGSEEILKKVYKQVDLEKVGAAVSASVSRGLKVSCFFVIGFPDDTAATLKSTLKAIRRFALLGAHDVSVAQFVPYPGSELFRSLQAAGKISMDDKFFVSPLNFYTDQAACYSDHITQRYLYWMMIWMFVNFYLISFARRPIRTAVILYKAVFTGIEETRFAKWARDRLFIRRRWRRDFQLQSPSKS
jgi:anaerobic magnesium-protoporphyrin IX monomethyl ester cyclase